MGKRTMLLYLHVRNELPNGDRTSVSILLHPVVPNLLCRLRAEWDDAGQPRPVVLQQPLPEDHAFHMAEDLPDPGREEVCDEERLQSVWADGGCGGDHVRGDGEDAGFGEWHRFKLRGQCPMPANMGTE